MLFILEQDPAPSRWHQVTEVVLVPEVSSILVTAFGLIDAQAQLVVMDIKTTVVTPEQAKMEIDKSMTIRLEKGYKTVENTRFRAMFIQ